MTLQPTENWNVRRPGNEVRLAYLHNQQHLLSRRLVPTCSML